MKWQDRPSALQRVELPLQSTRTATASPSQGCPGGLYWPLVGVYDSKTMERLPIKMQRGDRAIMPTACLHQDHRQEAQDHATTQRRRQAGRIYSPRGYDLDLPETGLRPGSTFTLTLYYHSRQPTTRISPSLSIFTALRNGMASQKDAPPLAVPTRPGRGAWRGHHRTAPLTVAADARTARMNCKQGYTIKSPVSASQHAIMLASLCPMMQ